MVLNKPIGIGTMNITKQSDMTILKKQCEKYENQERNTNFIGGGAQRLYSPLTHATSTNK